MTAVRQSSPLAFEKAPLLCCAAALALGIILSAYLPGAKWLGLGAAVAGLYALRWPGRVAFAVLIFIGVGMLLGTREAELSPDRVRVLMDSGRIPENHPARMRGRIESDPEPAPQGLFLHIRAEYVEIRSEGLTVSGTVRVFVSTVSEDSKRILSELDPRSGDLVRVSLRLERGDRYLNPGVVRNRDVLDGQGLDAAARLKSAHLIEIVERRDHLLPGLRSSRNELVERMVRIFPQPVSGVMVASLLGNRYYLDKRIGDLFREGGTFHVLVISGLHITFIGGLLLLISSLLTSDRRVQYLVAAGCLWGYSFAVGAEIPVLRAVLMFSIMLAGRMVHRKASTLNSLGCTALILLMWRPSDLFSPSFQLTFLSVWAIAAIAMPLSEKMKAVGEWTPTRSEPLPPHVWPPLKRFCETLYWREEKWEFELRRSVWSGIIFKNPYLDGRLSRSLRPLLKVFFEGFLYTVAVLAVMLPIQIFYFHRMSTGGIFLDLWVGFFIAIESFLAVAAVVLSFFSYVAAEPLVKLTEAANAVLFFVPELFSLWDVSSVRVPLATGFGALTFLTSTCVFIVCCGLLRWDPFESTRNGRNFRWVVPLTLIVFLSSGFLLVFNPFGPRVQQGMLRVDFLDVGQGDSILITFSDGVTMLVDGGGRPKLRVQGDGEGEEGFEPDTREVGEAVVSEFLWERGYSHIDYLLATHADTDHMQGIETVAENFSFGRVLVGRFADGDPDFDSLTETLARRRKAPELIGTGDVLRIGGAEVRVLHPLLSERRGEEDGNSESVVLMITYGARRILLTGDIEKESERSLLRSGTPLEADVVKVGHHGSRTSSTEEFIRAVNADYAVVSVGRKSPFGHPHGEVVGRWKASGARVITTGEHGTISVETDGHALSVRTFAATLK